MTTRKDLMNEAYDGLHDSTVLVGLSMATKKLFGEKLTVASTIKDTIKLTAGVTAGTILVRYAQDKKWLPEIHLNLSNFIWHP